jgi:hypothetical protein
LLGPFMVRSGGYPRFASRYRRCSFACVPWGTAWARRVPPYRPSRCIG